jgi:putative ABC transport system ATP-binding protein
LTVERGEAIGLVGPSGSGKSSLISVISGLEETTSGTVHVAGQLLNGQGEDALATFRRDNVGIVFQSFHLIANMTALENVAIPLEFAGVKDAFGDAERLLQRTGLGARLGHYPAQLSGGEQQRVAIARALANTPALILADEPTGNLDGATGSEITDLLFELQDEWGATLLLVTHDLELANRCDRVLEMRDGRAELLTQKPKRRLA